MPPNSDENCLLIPCSISNPLAKGCEATLRSVTEAFLPITYLFDRRTCLGPQVAELTIPNEAPNGTALLFWYVPHTIFTAELTFVRSCDGQPAEFCNLVDISSGESQEDSMPTLTSGELSCSDVSSTFYTSILSSSGSSAPAAGETTTGADTTLPSGESSAPAMSETTIGADTPLPSSEPSAPAMSETTTGADTPLPSSGSSAPAMSETTTGADTPLPSGESSAPAVSATSAARVTPSVPQVVATVTATVLATSFITVPCSQTTGWHTII